jgi:hypothetical protein
MKTGATGKTGRGRRADVRTCTSSCAKSMKTAATNKAG